MAEEPSKQILEAALLAASEPVSFDKLTSLVRIHAPKVKETLQELEEDYKDRGIELVKVASGYRFQVRQEYARYIQKLYEKSPPRYSRALLETLALVAYRQPITRGEIEEIRGVAVSAKIMKTLQEREWVKIVGHRDIPGKPALFSTTKQFLDYFNLRTLSDLPPLESVADLDQAEKELTEQLTLAVGGVKPTDIEEVNGNGHANGVDATNGADSANGSTNGAEQDQLIEASQAEDDAADIEMEQKNIPNEEAQSDST